jgi:hypothetical protein
LTLAAKFLEGADANPVDYEALIAMANGTAPAANSPSDQPRNQPVNFHSVDAMQVASGSCTYVLMVTSSIWSSTSGAKLVRCEAGSLSELVIKVAESCSLCGGGPDMATSGPGALADAAKASAPFQVLFNGQVLTEDTFATMPDRARIAIEYYGNSS